MNIQAINNQIFQSKFRVAEMSFSRPEGEKILTTTRYKVYNHPLAKDIYEKAKEIKDPQEQEKAMALMGFFEYEEETTSMDKILPHIRDAFCKKRPN